MDTKYQFLKIALGLFPFTYIFFLPSWLLVTRWVSEESGIVYPSRTTGLIRPLRIILFDTVVGHSYLSCQIALYSLNNPSVIFLREQLVSSFYVLCTMSPVSWNCPFWITQFRFLLRLNTFNGYFFNQKWSFHLVSGFPWFKQLENEDILVLNRWISSFFFRNHFHLFLLSIYESSTRVLPMTFISIMHREMRNTEYFLYYLVSCEFISYIH